jgi:hypothetical protein
MDAHHPEPLEKLKTYPVFQVLRAKAETHALKLCPKESKQLPQQGQFERVLDQLTAGGDLRHRFRPSPNRAAAEARNYSSSGGVIRLLD